MPRTRTRFVPILATHSVATHSIYSASASASAQVWFILKFKMTQALSTGLFLLANFSLFAYTCLYHISIETTADSQARLAAAPVPEPESLSPRA